MRTARFFFLGSRLWWAGVLLAAPVFGALTGNNTGTLGFTVLLALPAFVLFDNDQPWWSDEIRRLPEDRERWRGETRKLALSSLAAFVLGGAIASLLTLR
jgi:hypothetical protein